MTLPPRLARPLALPVLLALVAAFVVAAAAPASAKGPRTRARLTAFNSCQSLVGYARAYAARTGGTGVPTRVGPMPPTVLTAPAAGIQGAQPVAAAPQESSAAAGDAGSFSTTNVQETGIDEPDVVKTDGKHILTVADGRLDVVDVTGDAPRLVGSLALDGGFAHQLLLRGNRALVLSSAYGAIAVDQTVGGPVAEGPAPAAAAATRIAPVGGRPTTVLTEVDISDPAAPKVARSMTLDGAVVDARLTAGTARVVVSTSPQAPVPLEKAGLRAFVPTTTIRSRISGHTFRRGVVGCDDVRRPDVFSGLDLLSVLTIDLDRGLYSVDRDAIMAGAQTVYGSDKSLYVASQGYEPGVSADGRLPGSVFTEIHRFDASQEGRTAYAASGRVHGGILNQFALSEHEGVLRVASTDEPTWVADDVAPGKSHSSVTLLRQDGDRLLQIGEVAGLGEGERIYAVRFVGAAGFVVTFRQVDPLFALDLSKPDAPRTAGELHISGYSAYLHPVGEGLLLGVGQEVDADGRPAGTQVSLFDVGDLAAPKRLQHVVFGNGSSDAEFDHHAFLWWAPSTLAVLPLQAYSSTGGAPSFVGAVGLRVGRDGLPELGRVTHAGGEGHEPAPIARSLVVGDRLYTLSYLGLQANRLDTLAPVAFLRLTPPGA